MRPVKPYMRYVGVAFLAALLAIVSIKARACAESDEDPAPTWPIRCSISEV